MKKKRSIQPIDAKTLEWLTNYLDAETAKLEAGLVKPIKFKVGDVVKLNRKGLVKWRHQSAGNEGMIIADATDHDDTEDWYEVKWVNEVVNDYPTGSLTLVSKTLTLKPKPKFRKLKKDVNSLLDLFKK